MTQNGQFDFSPSGGPGSVWGQDILPRPTYADVVKGIRPKPTSRVVAMKPPSQVAAPPKATDPKESEPFAIRKSKLNPNAKEFYPSNQFYRSMPVQTPAVTVYPVHHPAAFSNIVMLFPVYNVFYALNQPTNTATHINGQPGAVTATAAMLVPYPGHLCFYYYPIGIPIGQLQPVLHYQLNYTIPPGMQYIVHPSAASDNGSQPQSVYMAQTVQLSGNSSQAATADMNGIQVQGFILQQPVAPPSVPLTLQQASINISHCQYRCGHTTSSDATSAELPTSFMDWSSDQETPLSSPSLAESTETEYATSEDTIERYASDLLDKFLASGVYDEAEQLVGAKKKHLEDMIGIWLETVVDRQPVDRTKLGELLARLLAKNIVSLNAVVAGFDQFIQIIFENGLATLNPLVWPYLGEVLGAILNNQCCNGPVMRLRDFYSLFHQSAGSKLKDILAHTLLTVLNNFNDPEQMISWIEANVTAETENNFVCALAQSLWSKVVCMFGDNYSFDQDQFKMNWCRVLQWFVKNTTDSEITLLIELAKIYLDYGCPGDLLTIMFQTLLDAQVIPHQAFLEWWQQENRQNKHREILDNSQIKRFIDVLNQRGKFCCAHCNETFENNLKLVWHIKNVHKRKLGQSGYFGAVSH